MVAIRATSAWLVQMLEVAFSRRICCSRGGEGQHETPVAVAVDGLAGKASGHLTQILFLDRDDPAERAAIAERDAEGLCFHGDDIGIDRRRNHAERNGFGDGDDEQSALGMGNGGDSRNVFNDAEEVGALHQHGGGFRGSRQRRARRDRCALSWDRSRRERWGIC